MLLVLQKDMLQKDMQGWWHLFSIDALHAGGCEGEEAVKAGAGEKAAQRQEVSSCHD